MKKLLLASALVFAFATPSLAQSTLTCDEATMTKMKTDIDAMTDKEKQTTSLAEYEMAMADMKGNKMAECEARIRQMDEKNKSSSAQ
jgi:hypothetical protein